MGILTVYDLTGFDIRVYLQNDHHNQDNKNIHNFKGHIMPFVISLSHSFPAPLGYHFLI